MPSDRDHQEVINALKRKANETPFGPEKKALEEKVKALEEKYGLKADDTEKVSFLKGDPIIRRMSYEEFTYIYFHAPAGNPFARPANHNPFQGFYGTQWYFPGGKPFNPFDYISDMDIEEDNLQNEWGDEESL